MSRSRMSTRERHLMKERERCGRKARFPKRRAPRKRSPAVEVDAGESYIGSVLALALRKMGMMR